MFRGHAGNLETTVAGTDFFHNIYDYVHKHNAPDVPSVHIHSQLNGLVDFPTIVERARQLEEEYRKIQSAVNEVL